MDTAELEIGDFSVHSFLRRDAFGLCFTGAQRSTGAEALILGLVPLEGRPITLDRLDRTLSSSRSAEASSLAEIIGIEELSQTEGDILLNLAQKSDDALIGSPQFLIVYQLEKMNPFSNIINQADDATKRTLMTELLSGLEQLHKRRAYHLALSPHTLWVSNGHLKLTHQGLFSLFKKRGLTLNRESSNELDQAISYRARYASPEELSNRLSNQTSDLYAVGAICYEIFVGPLDEPILNTQGVYERSLNCDSQEWNDFFSSACSESLRDRYANAELMMKTLNALPSSDGLQRQTYQTSNLRISEANSTFTSQQEENRMEPARLDSNSLESTLRIEVETNIEDSLEPRAHIDIGSHLEDSIESTDRIELSALDELDQIDPELDHTLSEQMMGSMIDSIDETSLDQVSPSRNASMPLHQADFPKESTDVRSDALDQSPNPLQSHTSPLTGKTSPLSQTIGFFSGGSEVASSSFQSLKSQLGASESSKEQTIEDKTPQERDANELAFGASDDDFGFEQSHQDERTFLEFSDVDDQTVFEVDHDAFVEESHTNTFGKKQRETPLPDPPRFQTMAYVSQGADLSSQLDLQIPDFLEGSIEDHEPSRVLPIPSRQGILGPSQDSNSLPHAPVSLPASSLPTAPKVEAIHLTPAPLTQDEEIKPFSALPPISPTPKPTVNSTRSQLQGNAQDWPGSESSQVNYTPPSQPLNPPSDARQAPRMQQKRSVSSKLLSLLIPLILIGGGGSGVYWVGLHWHELSKLIQSDAPESLSISTAPSNMQVIINHKPYKDKTPLLYRFEGQFSTGEPLPIRFLWDRKMHTDKINLPSGPISLYFLAEEEKSKSSRFRRKKKAKPTLFAQGSITSEGESLQVLLDDQPIGQTPMIIIGPQGKALSIKVLGPGIERSIMMTPDSTEKSRIIINK